MTTILSIQASVVSVSSQHGALTRAIQLTFSSVYQLVGLRTPQLASSPGHTLLPRLPSTKRGRRVWPGDEANSTAGLTNAPQCSAVAGGQCSLDVPADSNYRALIVTDLPTNNPDLSENINIRLQCSSTRGWAYAVVVLVPLLLVVGVIITTVILLVVCCWRKRDSLRATCCRRHKVKQTQEQLLLLR